METMAKDPIFYGFHLAKLSVLQPSGVGCQKVLCPSRAEFRLFSSGLIFGKCFHRWGDDDALIPEEVLPVGVQEEAGGLHHQPVLPVRQPDADHVHVLPLPGGAAGLAGRLHRDPEVWPAAVDALRRDPLLRRSHHQRLGQGRLDAHPRPHAARFRNRVRQPGTH